MKSKKWAKALTIVFLNLIIYQLNAQSIQKITPSNALESAIEIKTLYGDMIDASVQEIEDFYLHFWSTNTPYSVDCESLQASMTNNDIYEASFEWADLLNGNVDAYKIAYLQLSNGNQQAYSTTDNFISINTPPDGFYLFAFSSTCTDFASALDIIIVERPISIQEKLLCACPQPTLIWSPEFNNNNDDDLNNDGSFVSESWDALGHATKYYCTLEMANDGIPADFIFEIAFNSSGIPYQVKISRDCMTNVNLHEDETRLYYYNPANENTELGEFGFIHSTSDPESQVPSEPSFSFNYSNPQNGGMLKLYKCKDKYAAQQYASNVSEQASNPVQLSFENLTNPFKQKTTLKYELPENDYVSISLYDSQGNLIRHIKNQVFTEAGSHTLNLDFKELANGLYFCILKTKTATKNLKMVKID